MFRWKGPGGSNTAGCAMMHDVIVSIRIAKDYRQNTVIGIITRLFIVRNSYRLRCCLGEYSFATDHVVASAVFI